MTTEQEIKFIKNSLYLVLNKDVADDISKRIGRLLKQSYLEGAEAQRESDLEACEESMNQWYNETATLLRNRPLVISKQEILK